jgi:hypothetical protein
LDPVVQPATDNEATTISTIIAVIDFNCIMLSQKEKVGLTIPIRFFQTEEPRSQP